MTADAPSTIAGAVAACPSCGAEAAAGTIACATCGTVLAAREPSDLPRSSWLGPDEDDLDVPAATADPLIGVVVADRYRIREPIGRGGMGVVYKVEHVRMGKLMALKLLAGELSRDRDVVARFKREALTASRLSHPNTVQVFDFGSADGLTYLAMELLTGQDLGRALRTDGPLPFARLGRMVVQVCGSLHEAHSAGIVHRDLKPENVFVLAGHEREDLVKVLDFGLAKLRESSELNDVTSAGAIVGTPYYMSPEQIRGEQVDPRSDVYAMGALMYRALTGAPPFQGATPLAVLTKHLTEEPAPPIERAPHLAIPRGVNDLVLRSLAKDPRQRFATIEQMRAAVVAELKRSGISSVDRLLDSSELRQLTRAARAADATARSMRTPEVATRDEVAAYEQKLRRQRVVGWVIAGVVVLAAAGLGYRAWLRATAAPRFDGNEREPNDKASEANAVPFGAAVRAQIGKRLDAQQGERDFFAIEVPAPPGGGPAIVRVDGAPLPNLATCTLLFRAGLDEPIGTYCAGAPARPLAIDALRVEPGRYLLAVLQDRDPYVAGPPVPVHENVSDWYTLQVSASRPDPGREIEPDDAVETAVKLAAGGEVRGTFGWMRDEDVVCLAPGEGKVRVEIRDSERRPRDPGAVLEATFVRAGPRPGIPVRVHRAQADRKPAGADVTSPWTSEPVALADGACVKLRLVTDPWSDRPGIVPPAGPEEWVLRADPVR